MLLSAVMARVVVLVIEPIAVTLPHFLSWLLKLPIISCPPNIASFLSIAVLKVVFFLIHTYLHFICFLSLIYNYCNLPVGSCANLDGSCFQEINATKSIKRPKKT